MNGMTGLPRQAAAVRGSENGFSVFDGAFMAIDIVGSSAALLADDEWRGLIRLRTILGSLAARIHVHGGTTLKSLGDGLEAVFERPAAALACAGDLLTSAAGREEERLGLFRIGLAAGQMIRYAALEGADVFGHCVIIAAKLAKLGRAPSLMCPVDFPGASRLASDCAGLHSGRFQARIGGMPGRYWRISQREPRAAVGLTSLWRTGTSFGLGAGAECRHV